jgi:hypothetical protein
VLAEQDVEVQELLGQIPVGTAGDIQGLGQFPAGVVGDERGEDRYGPVSGRDAELSEGGNEDAGVPGATPVGAIDGD